MGLTGSFGSGKSTVGRFFHKMGAKVIDSDRLAHEAFRKGNPLRPRLRSLFRKESKALNRAEIARIVFRDKKKRRRLESLIHPYVFRRLWEEVAKAAKPLVILEVPLLFESGFHRHCDRTIVVRSRASKVLKRLGRKKFRPEEVRARWRAQMSLREETRRADYLVDNSDGLTRTRRQVERIWKQLINERSLSKHGQR